MGHRAEMNQLAIEIANRDDAPFPKSPDTMVYDPHKDPALDPIGQYSHRRTSREGLATEEEFAEVFFPETHPKREALIKRLYELAVVPYGETLTGFTATEQKPESGVVADVPFLTIRRTPNTYLPGQSDPTAQTFYMFVGNLWLPIDYQSGGKQLTTHTSLLSLRRDPFSGEASVPQENTSLAFGEVEVARALMAVR